MYKSENMRQADSRFKW